MKRVLILAVSVLFAAPALYAADGPTPEELFERSAKGVENQRAWVATIEKQLATEKANLDRMEEDHQRLFGGKPKAAAKSVEKLEKKAAQKAKADEAAS